jgi:hypothetical protein
MGCSYKKFTPKNHSPPEVLTDGTLEDTEPEGVSKNSSSGSTNHSPQGRKVGSATLDPAEFKDTEPEEMSANSEGGSLTQEIQRSGSTDSLSDKRIIRERWAGEEIVIYPEKYVKEFIKKLKEVNINKTGKTLIIPMKDFNELAGEALI